MTRRAHFLTPLLAAADGHVLAVATRDLVVATTIECAFDSTSRTRGLLGRDGLPADTALIIAPCGAVHTFGMRFAIDVIMAAHDGRVVKLRASMPPARMTGAIGAFATIEMAAGSIARASLAVGDMLVVQPSRAAAVLTDPA